MSKKPPFLELSNLEQKASVEALVFSSEEPVTLDYLFRTLILEDVGSKSKIYELNFDSDRQLEDGEELNTIDHSYFSNIIYDINEELNKTGRPYEIVKIGGGYQFATRKEFGSLVHQLTKSKAKKRLSQAALETISIIAYKQPVTKPEIEQIRGVNSNEVVNSLIDKHLVEVKGRKDTLGKPLMFGTTPDFLKHFGINDLQELPKLREIDEFAESELSQPDKMEVIIDASTPSEKIEEIQRSIDSEYTIVENTGLMTDDDDSATLADN
jgi:segregation and condensation protein B